jgi:hypothetical protein
LKIYTVKGVYNDRAVYWRGRAVTETYIEGTGGAYVESTYTEKAEEGAHAELGGRHGMYQGAHFEALSERGPIGPRAMYNGCHSRMYKTS